VTQTIQLASREGISYAAAVKQLKVPTVKAPLKTVLLSRPTMRSIETQTDIPIPLTDIPIPLTRTIETQTEECSNQQTQTEATGLSKKRQLSDKPETNKLKKKFVDLTEAEFLAGEDGEDDEDGEGETNLSTGSYNYLDHFVRTCEAAAPPDPPVVQPPVRPIPTPDPPAVKPPVKQTPKGNQKK